MSSNMWTQRLSAVFVGVIVLTTVQGQSTAPPSTAEDTKMDEKGLILAIEEYWLIDDEPMDLRHLHSFPGIETFEEPNSTKIALDDPNYEIISLDVDFRRSNLFMYDAYYGTMLIGANYSAGKVNSEFKYKELRQLMSQTTVQVAYDWLSHTLYWCDSTFKLIVAAPGEWEKVEDDIYKVIAFEHLELPDGITVDPIEGYVFWSDNGDHPKIEKAHLDGSKRHTIVSKNLKSPMSLEADVSTSRLYWIDSDSVLSANYDGIVTLITRLSGAFLFDIAVFRDALYVNDVRYDLLMTFNKTTGDKLSDTINYGDVYETVYGLAVYTDETQPLKDRDFCAEKQCDHICVSEKFGARCLCGEGYRLNTTTQKCDEYAGAFHKAFVYANASHICLVDIRSMMGNSYFEPECRFTMIKPSVVEPAPRRRKRQVMNDTTTPQTTNQTESPTKATSTLPPTPTPIPLPTVAPEDSIKMIEVDDKDRFVFFVTQDNRIFSRSIDLPIENDQRDEMAVGSSEITGLAFDSEDSNLFWSQTDGHIYAINVKSKSVVRLTNDSQPQMPKDLIVLMHKRKLAFIAGAPDNMSIQMMNMDGTNITSVLDNSENISSLIFEKDENRFYYLATGRGVIYYVELDNPGVPEYRTRFPDESTYILLEYHGYFIWVYESEKEPNLLKSVEKSSPFFTVGDFRFDNVSSVVDMVVLDADRQAMKPGLCSRANGGCAHICISKMVDGNAMKECQCKKGFTLAEDKLNCTTEPFIDDFIIILDWTNDEIMQFSLDKFELRAIPAQRSYFYTSTYLDPDTMRLYWSAFWNINVMSSNLDGTDARSEAAIIYAYPYKYAKDSSTGNMYYIATYNDHVGVVTATGINIWLNEDDFSGSELTAIAVHPANGHLYVGVLGYDDAYVARLDMDGRNMKVLMKGDHIKQAEGIAIDFIHDHLYVCDYIEDTVIQCNLDGEDCLTIVNTTDMQITDIVTDGTHLYYTSFKQDYVVRVDLQPPYNHITIGENQGLGKVSSISFYSSKNQNMQAVENACLDKNGLGDCSTICLPTPDGRRCACEEGVDLHPDGITCENVHLCKAVIAHKNPDNKEAIEIRFPSSCIRRENNTCEYECPVNYVRINETNTMLTCELDGWDRETHVLCKEKRCPTTFDNGAVKEGCSRNIGSVCDFTCDEGFVKSKTDIFCRDDELWHGHDSGICTPYKCNASIPNVKLDNSCSRTNGSTCSFTCDKYYDYTSQEIRQITCGENGWNIDTTTLCSDAMCDDSSLMNGMVVADCVNHIGRSCHYKCDNFFTNTTEEVVCKFDQKWHPIQACKTLHCPTKIMNGFVDIKCSQEVNSECQYHCDDLFSPVNQRGNIKCLPSGQWNESDNLCLEPSVTPSPQSKESDTSPGLIAGLVILAVVVLALIIALVSMHKKNKSSSSSYKTSGNVTIENPGYSSTSMSSVDVNIDRPYSGDQN